MRFADEHMRGDIRTLWQACFGDGNAYIDAFLNHYDLSRHMLVFMDGEKPASMLSLLPMTVVTKSGVAMAGRYVYGVATDPRYRGRGLSTKLLEYAHKVLKQQGVALSVLVPAGNDLFRFYGKRGYESSFFMGMGVVSSSQVSIPKGSFAIESASEVQYYQIRERAFSGRAMFVRWDGDALGYRLSETAMLGGETLLLTTQTGQAVAVCYALDGQLLVKELALAGISLQTALGMLKEKYHPHEFSLRLPMDCCEGADLHRTPWAMAYWYDSKLREQVLSGLESAGEPYMNLVMD